MATWYFYGYEDSVATTLANGQAISSDSALVFGATNRNTFMANITLGSWHASMHHGSEASESAVDLCSDPHFIPVKPGINYTYSDWASSADVVIFDSAYYTSHNDAALSTPGWGIGLRFTHETSVRCHPVQIWAGSGAQVDAAPQSCAVAIYELSSTTPTWDTTNPSNKISLASHGTGATEHWWSVGLAVMPLVVGAEGDNKIKCEVTYF